jgi:hypothetical protein
MVMIGHCGNQTLFCKIPVKGRFCVRKKGQRNHGQQDVDPQGENSTQTFNQFVINCLSFGSYLLRVTSTNNNTYNDVQLINGAHQMQT